jgi:DNA-binding transcriptional LysR family regulator
MLEEGRLRALLAISEHGGSSGAARALGRPVTEVTGQVSDWERELGLPLVDGDRLTPAGRRLAEHAGILLGQLESAGSDAAAVAGRATGTLRLGVGADAGRVLLPEVLAALGPTELTLHVRQLADERVDALDSTLDMVVVGEYGAAVPHRADPTVERRELLTEPLLLAVPARHRGTGASIRLAELAGATWIAGTGDALVALERAAAGAGFAPTLGAEVGEDALALTLVAAGLGVALVPASAAPAPIEGVRFLTVLDGGLRRTVLAAVRRSRAADPGVQQLLDALAGAARRVAAAVPGVTAAIAPSAPPVVPPPVGPPGGPSGGPARRPDPLFDPLPPEGTGPRSNGRPDPWADRLRPEPSGTDLPSRNGTNGLGPAGDRPGSPGNGLWPGGGGTGPTGGDLDPAASGFDPAANGLVGNGPAGTELSSRNGSPADLPGLPPYEGLPPLGSEQLPPASGRPAAPPGGPSRPGADLPPAGPTAVPPSAGFPSDGVPPAGGPAADLPPAGGRPPGDLPPAGGRRPAADHTANPPRRPAPTGSADPTDLSGLSGLAGFGGPRAGADRPGADRPDAGVLPPPGPAPGPAGADLDGPTDRPGGPTSLPAPGADLPHRGGASPYRTPPATGDDPGFTPDLPGRSGPNPYRPDSSAHPAPDPFRGGDGADGPNPYRSNGSGQPADRREPIGGSELFTASRRPGPSRPDPPATGRRARARGGDGEGTLPPAPAGAAEDVRLSIFEDLQSEWFVQRPGGEPSPSWQMAADDGWAAAARLAEPTTAGTTTAGLPRRRPQAMVVPGAVGGSAAPGGDVPPQPSSTYRSPQEVRGRLSSYRDGVRRGRHAERAADERE